MNSAVLFVRRRILQPHLSAIVLKTDGIVQSAPSREEDEEIYELDLSKGLSRNRWDILSSKAVKARSANNQDVVTLALSA